MIKHSVGQQRKNGLWILLAVYLLAFPVDFNLLFLTSTTPNIGDSIPVHRNCLEVDELELIWLNLVLYWNRFRPLKAPLYWSANSERLCRRYHLYIIKTIVLCFFRALSYIQKSTTKTQSRESVAPLKCLLFIIASTRYGQLTLILKTFNDTKFQSNKSKVPKIMQSLQKMNWIYFSGYI